MAAKLLQIGDVCHLDFGQLGGIDVRVDEALSLEELPAAFGRDVEAVREEFRAQGVHQVVMLVYPSHGPPTAVMQGLCLIDGYVLLAGRFLAADPNEKFSARYERVRVCPN